jgi:hypothetical protein
MQSNVRQLLEPNFPRVTAARAVIIDVEKTRTSDNHYRGVCCGFYPIRRTAASGVFSRDNHRPQLAYSVEKTNFLRAEDFAGKSFCG